jgi:surfactin synthase thioesterase subunit
VVAFPYAGGGASVFREWGAALPAEVELLAVQLPGREERYAEPVVDDLGTLADRVFEVLLAHPAGPVALVGHSMGALLALEVGLRLERAARAPMLLVASGSAAPLPEALSDAASGDRSDTLEAAAGVPGVYLSALEADLRACRHYAGPNGRRLSCPVRAYIGLADPDVSRPEAEAWRSFTNAECVVVGFPGDHFFIRTHSDLVAHRLTHDLVTCGVAARSGA